jgi:predicted nucleic acid-binding protein
MVVINKLRLYLDNCCFNRPFDDQAQLKIRLETEAKVDVQQKILDGLYELAWSYVMDYENELNPFPERKYRIAFWKNIAVTTCNETEAILVEAEKLQAIGVKMFDSLHAACARYMNCDYLLTTDERLLKKRITTVQTVDPIEFVKREYV